MEQRRRTKDKEKRLVRPGDAKSLKDVNDARRELGLPLLSVKTRKCIQCSKPFESIEARTCEPCLKKREVEDY